MDNVFTNVPTSSNVNQSLNLPRADSTSKIPAPPRSVSRLALPRTRVPQKRKSVDITENENNENVPPNQVQPPKRLKSVSLPEPSSSTNSSGSSTGIKRAADKQKIKRARRSIHKAKELLKFRSQQSGPAASSNTSSSSSAVSKVSSTRTVGRVAPTQRSTTSTARVASIKKTTTEPVRSSPRLKARAVSRTTLRTSAAGTSSSRSSVGKPTVAGSAAGKPKRDKWDFKGKLQDTKEELSHYKNQYQSQSTAIEDIQRRLSTLESEKQNLVAEKTTLATTSTHREQEINQLKSENFTLQQQLQSQQTAAMQEAQELKTQVQSLQLQVKTLQTELMQAKINLDSAKRDILFEQQKIVTLKSEHASTVKMKDEENLQLQQKNNALEDENVDLKTKLAAAKEEIQEGQVERKKLLNDVQELKGNIRVFCRVRPMTGKEKSEQGEMNHIKFVCNSDKEMEVFNADGKNTDFSFDKVFKPGATQMLVFEEVSMLIQSALDGYNVCIFAYGQTGAGKTYTMEGPGGKRSNDDVDEQKGIIPRAMDLIFSRTHDLGKHGWTYKFEMQHLEIYNDNLVDLLNNSSGNPDSKKLEIKTTSEKKENKVWVKNVTSHPVENINQVNRLLQQSKKARTTAATKANDRSSRSHAVFILKIKGKNDNTGEEVESDLNLIDLAGSERISDTGAQGMRLKEAQKINSSLSNLSNVISALANKESHVPFRNQKLTFLLKDSLGGNSKTLMIVNVNPVKSATSETLNTLRFATTVNKCNIGTAQKAVKF